MDVSVVQTHKLVVVLCVSICHPEGQYSNRSPLDACIGGSGSLSVCAITVVGDWLIWTSWTTSTSRMIEVWEQVLSLLTHHRCICPSVPFTCRHCLSLNGWRCMESTLLIACLSCWLFNNRQGYQVASSISWHFIPAFWLVFIGLGMCSVFMVVCSLCLWLYVVCIYAIMWHSFWLGFVFLALLFCGCIRFVMERCEGVAWSFPLTWLR